MRVHFQLIYMLMVLFLVTDKAEANDIELTKQFLEAKVEIYKARLDIHESYINKLKDKYKRLKKGEGKKDPNKIRRFLLNGASDEDWYSYESATVHHRRADKKEIEMELNHYQRMLDMLPRNSEDDLSGFFQISQRVIKVKFAYWGTAWRSCLP